MNKYKELYGKVAVLKANFEKILDKIKTEDNFAYKLELAKFALEYAVFNNTGYFTSTVLENVFVEYARSLNVDISDISYKPNTFLHVLTTGYDSGGHTRVVERWIDNAPSEQSHSVVIIEPNNASLATLKNNVSQKNGDLIAFNKTMSLDERALALRKLGMNYKYIVLHTHMQDPTAVIAFGSKDFTRPVMLYNHASHLFWLGKSVSDVHLDLLKDDPITIQKRNITNTFFAGIPMKDIDVKKVDKLDLRKKIGLPLDKKIIVSAGNKSKYYPICNDNYAEMLKDLIDDDTYVYVIGVKNSHPMWKKVFKETNGHIVALQPINFKDGYLDYIGSADLYLDSYPCVGYTAIIDAISMGVPVLSLNTVLAQLDYFTVTDGFCENLDVLISKAKRILCDELQAQELNKQQLESLINFQSVKKWNERIKLLLETVPFEHTVKDFNNEFDYSEIDDLSVLANALSNPNFLKRNVSVLTDKEISFGAKYGLCYKKVGIPFVFEVVSYRKVWQKSCFISLFNKPLVKLK